MEAERLSTSDRTIAPNRYVVHLNPVDLEAFGDLSGSLATELADNALLFARSHRYTLVDRPRVDILSDPTVARSDIHVEARFAEPGGMVEGTGTPDDPGLRQHDPTMVFTVPTPVAPRARLRLTESDGTEREVALDGSLVTIGRSEDNGLVIRDGRVSRHHARISARRGTFVYTDLQSTNGSRVNGEPVEEIVLGYGDRIELGDCVVTVEAPGD